MHLGNKRAFTLAELLTAVLVISVIMVALAPVITKRMKDTVSVQTDNREGLEIYTNPGTYTFDVPIGINTLFIQGSGGGGAGAGSTYVEKNVSFVSNTTWNVPSGVNQITFTIIGAGGGGGGANGSNNTKHPDTSPKVYNNSCSSDEFTAIRASTEEYDLCITKENKGGSSKPINESCTTTSCCWTSPNAACYGGGCNRKVCTYNAAYGFCANYKAYAVGAETIGAYTYRLAKEQEWKKIQKYLGPWNRDVAYQNSLQLCTYNAFNSGHEASNVAQCSGVLGCGGLGCGPSNYWVNKDFDGNFKRWAYDNKASQYIANESDGLRAFSVRCVRSLNRYNRYSGAGGSSGAVMEKTINVLPKDVFEITIGSGGNGGAARTKGSQGGTTKIVHKRGSVELGTYYVKGGLGGNGATTSAHGSAYSNSTSSSGTTPSGTCYARDRKDTTDSFSGGNTSCTTLSYSGEGGSSTKGGNGGRVKNTGTINDGDNSSGGYLYIDSNRTANQRATNTEISYAKGQNASIYGFGGGGGLTPAWANSTSHFYSGGKGANGRVDIVYKVALPGGGGGSASRVAGVNGNNKMYEIKYKVAEGDRIVFKVGSGGTGGVEGQDGLNGSATVIGDNDIVFLGGEGGKVATESDKSSLIGGRGGSSGCVNEEDNIQSVTSGIKIKNSTTTKYSITPSNGSFKGQAGRRGGVPSSSDIQSGYSINNTVFAYGFSGGMGGSPFNVESSKIGASITCSGGIYGTLGQMTSIKYLCTSGNIKGNDARSHDPVNNEFGGSGGGGGGVVGDSFEQGSGGNGSSGYLRIRWDMSEQE